MRRFRNAILSGIGAAWLVAGLGVGCSSEPKPENNADAVGEATLNEFAEAYRMFQIAKDAPPRKVADMAALEGAGGNGVAAVRDGQIVVQWGAALPDIREEPGQSEAPEVLAYWKTVPEEGGYVLLLDRTVKKMTAEEFSAAPKAPGNPDTSEPKKKR